MHSVYKLKTNIILFMAKLKICFWDLRLHTMLINHITCNTHKIIYSLTPRCSPSLTLSVCISLTVRLHKLWVIAFCAVSRVEAFRSCTATTDMTGFQIRNWMSAPTDTSPPSLVFTYHKQWTRSTIEMFICTSIHENIDSTKSSIYVHVTDNITLHGGMLNARVLRSTLCHWSITGSTRTTPGPLGGRIRPSRKTTTLS